MIAFAEPSIEKAKAKKSIKSSGPGYNPALPNERPFMFVESHSKVKCGAVTIGVLAFGAYNAMGLIGSEKGGVAVVTDAPSRHVLATLDVPWNPEGRKVAAASMVKFIKENRTALKKSADVLVPEFKRLGYDSRIA